MHISPRTMITFDAAQTRFTYRVGGILLHNGHLLCQAAPLKDFWFLPGGRAELRESAETTLRREMREELGVEVTIGRLVYVVENFFNDENGFQHELGLYFLVTAPADSYFYQSLETFMHSDELHIPLRFDWLPLQQLEQWRLLPTLFQKALQQIPEQTVHIVHRDE